MENNLVILQAKDLQKILDNLKHTGYQTLAPTIKENTIVYDEISKIEQLPIGFIDEQEGGFYRLEKHSKPSFFSYTVGANSWKKYLHPPKVKLWQIRRKNKAMEFIKEESQPSKFAFIGVRACELTAISIQDRVFLKDKFVDPIYAERRNDVFIIAVNCARAVKTCFCVSMDSGPKAKSGFDLAFTEVIEKNKHFFLVEIGTEKGKKILENIPQKVAKSQEKKLAESIVEKTAQNMGRTLDRENIKEILYRNYESLSWDEVASRCLSCANCTMVCPTCFCTTVEDTTDLTGDIAERWRRWDSCFTGDFSYIHGGSVRDSTKSRYRQWLVHKLAAWIDQFDSSGCVGCGRCITWCPVGIDITEQSAIIRKEDSLRKVTL